MQKSREGMGQAQRCAPGSSALQSVLAFFPSLSSACCKASGLVGVEFRAGVSSRESFLPTAPCTVCFRPAWSRHPVTVCTMLLRGRER